MALHGLPYIIHNEDTTTDELIERLEKALVEHPEDELKILKFLVPYSTMSNAYRKQVLAYADRFYEVSEKEEDKKEALYWKGTTLFEERIDLDEAEEIFIDLITKDPDYESAYEPLISLYLVRNEPEKALDYATRLAKLDAMELIGLSRKGDVLRFMNKPNEALGAYLSVLNAEPHRYFSLNGVAKCYLMLEEYAKAREYFELAYEHCHYEEPLNPYGVGLCYQHLDDPYRAMKWYSVALEISPVMPQALNNMATLHHELNNGWEEAVPFLLKAVTLSNEAINPDMQPVYRNLWAYYTNILDHEKAEYYQRLNYKCLGLDDDFFDAINGFE